MKFPIQKNSISNAKPASRLVMSIWTVILLLPIPARADFLLYRAGDSLHLISPDPLIHLELPPSYPWEGPMSTFQAEYRGGDLVLTLHRDWRETPWWFDAVIVQKPCGTVLVAWYSTGNPDDVLFARYPSFRAAWSDNRFRRTLQPALCALHQTLPRLRGREAG